MKIESLKQLEQLMKLCRKQGIAEIKVDSVELKLGEAIHKVMKRRLEYDPMAELKVPKPNILDSLSNSVEEAEEVLPGIENQSITGTELTDGQQFRRIDGVEFAKMQAAKATKALKEKISTPDELTEDQLLNWSVRPEAGQEQ